MRHRKITSQCLKLKFRLRKPSAYYLSNHALKLTISGLFQSQQSNHSTTARDLIEIRVNLYKALLSKRVISTDLIAVIIYGA